MKVRARINGKLYTRSVQWLRVAYGDDEYSEKVPFITINNRLYMVFIKNGVPQSVYDWEKYNEQFQPNDPGRVTSRARVPA